MRVSYTDRHGRSHEWTVEEDVSTYEAMLKKIKDDCFEAEKGVGI